MTLPAASGRRPAARDRAADLAARAQRLADEQEVENLQKIYGYYYDRRMWDEVADLFADDGTIEMAQRGVYVGKPRVREFLNLLGPVGLKDGELNDHVQLQVVVHVAPDGRSAKARSRELNMTGVFESHGEWSEGIYENTFVKDDGVWKIKDLRYFPTFISDYDKGWAGDAKPAPAASTELPPDRPPTSVYAIYPKAHIPPFHYDNPASGAEPRYPQARGRPSDAAIAAVRAPVDVPRAARGRQPQQDVEALVARAEQQSRARQGLPRDRQPDERVRLLPRQEPLERPRESVFRERLDRARAARRVHRPRARARVPVQRVRQGRARARTGSATTSSTKP